LVRKIYRVWIPLQRSDFVYEKGRFADVTEEALCT